MLATGSHAKMSQQNIETGLEALDSLSEKGDYLAAIVRNKKAEISDVAQVAIAATYQSLPLYECSLVLSTVFHLSDVVHEGKKKKFCQAVDRILGPDHLRRTIPKEKIVLGGDSGVGVMKFIDDQLKERDGLEEKIYFLANVVIACVHNKASESMGFPYDAVVFDVVMSVKQLSTEEPSALKTFRLFLNRITGENKVVQNEISRSLEDLMDFEKGDKKKENHNNNQGDSCLVL